MAATYTPIKLDKTAAGVKLNIINVVYNTEAYSSGLSLDKAQLGCPNAIAALYILGEASSSNTNIYKYDQSTQKIRGYNEVAGTYFEISGNQTRTFTVWVFGI